MLPRQHPPGRPALTPQELHRGRSLCLKNVKKLLQSSKVLIGSEPMHALVFYSIAVEEYGKMLWLAELEESMGDATEISAPRGLFTNHKEKLKRGFNALPQSCSNVMHGVRLRANSIGETKTVWYNPEKDSLGSHRARGSVSIGAGLTGHFVDALDAGGVAELATRLEGMYVDWFYAGSSSVGQWSPSLALESASLRSAIQGFELHLRSTARLAS